MSIAQAFPAMDRPSSRWLLLGSLALNLFFVGIAIAMMVRSPAPSWDRNVFVRVERLAATLPPTDADILRGEINTNRTAIENAQAAYHAAQDSIHNVLRQEPFDADRDDEDPDGPVDVGSDDSGRFCHNRYEDFTGWPAGLGQLAAGAEARQRQTVVVSLPPSSCGRVLKDFLNARGWEAQGGGNESLGAPVLDHVAGPEPDTAARRLPADRRQAGAGAEYSVVL